MYPENKFIDRLMYWLYDTFGVNWEIVYVIPIIGDYVQDQFRDRAGRKDLGVREQGILVLAQIAMPGVLVETGFISNPEEEKYLLSTQGQDIISSAIYRGFREYKETMPV